MFRLFKKAPPLTEFNIENTIPFYGFLQNINDDNYLEVLNKLITVFESLNWDGKELLVQNCDVEYISLLEFLDEKSPDNYLVNLLLGEAFIKKGWQIRTGERAENVSDNQIEGFFEQLQIAEEFLLNSIELNQSYEQAYTCLMKLYTGISEYESFLNAFEKGNAINPENIFLYTKLMWGNSPRWTSNSLGNDIDKMRLIMNDAMSRLSSSNKNYLWFFYIEELYTELDYDEFYDVSITQEFKKRMASSIEEFDNMTPYFNIMFANIMLYSCVLSNYRSKDLQLAYNVIYPDKVDVDRWTSCKEASKAIYKITKQ